MPERDADEEGIRLSPSAAGKLFIFIEFAIVCRRVPSVNRADVGLLAVAVLALQISQTIAEEEDVRGAHISAPTRVRRFLSRFFVVVVVALAIEGLVATFKAQHEDPAQLPYAASLLFAVGILLIGWGAFIRFNRSAEELEPEAMAEAKREDQKLG